MKDNIAAQVLDRLLGWDRHDPDVRLAHLQAMADWKFDAYEGFRAGQRFLESLARWLQGFPTVEARLRWVDFVLDRLTFLSSAEMDQAISVVYPALIRPLMLARAAQATEIARHRTAQLSRTPEFQIAMRRTLVVGLSDGARLDLLRRACPGLSHEQFSLTTRPAEEQRRSLLTSLAAALDQYGHDGDPTFDHVLLVDDFYGSGTSLIDLDESGQRIKLKPKFGQFLQFVEPSYFEEGAAVHDSALLAPGFSGTIVLYVASHKAIEHIRACLAAAGLDGRFAVWVAQIIPESAVVRDEILLADCDQFWDPALEDEHKGNSARGYKQCALPVVLQHNAPNNAISPLWADSTDRPGNKRRALFPRYERHHVDRP